MGHVRVIAALASTQAASDSRIWIFFPINFPESTKTQVNKNIMCRRSTVLTHIFLHLHSKQRFNLLICMHIS